MAKFRIATPAGASFSVAGGEYGYEMEALTPIDAEIFEIPPGSEDEFAAAARGADALYAKGRRITKKMIDGLERCKIISLGSVGVDSVDVDAATAKGIPVTMPGHLHRRGRRSCDDVDPGHLPPADRAGQAGARRALVRSGTMAG